MFEPFVSSDEKLRIDAGGIRVRRRAGAWELRYAVGLTVKICLFALFATLFPGPEPHRAFYYGLCFFLLGIYVLLAMPKTVHIDIDAQRVREYSGGILVFSIPFSQIGNATGNINWNRPGRKRQYGLTRRGFARPVFLSETYDWRRHAPSYMDGILLPVLERLFGDPAPSAFPSGLPEGGIAFRRNGNVFTCRFWREPAIMAILSLLLTAVAPDVFGQVWHIALFWFGFFLLFHPCVKTDIDQGTVTFGHGVFRIFDKTLPLGRVSFAGIDIMGLYMMGLQLYGIALQYRLPARHRLFFLGVVSERRATAMYVELIQMQKVVFEANRNSAVSVDMPGASPNGGENARLDEQCG